jgi:hypothetical protein
MKHYLLRTPERAATGFTDLFELTHADLTETTDNAAQVITLDALALGDHLLPGAILELTEAFTAAGTDDDLVVSIGNSTNRDLFLAEFHLVNSASATTFGKGRILTVGMEVNQATSLQAEFVVTGTSVALADYTTGSLRLWCNISRRRGRLQIQS